MERFAFMIHPLDISDISRKFGFAKKLPPRWLESALKVIPPLTVSEITGVRSEVADEIRGWFIGCPLTARQMMELDQDYVTRKIIKAAQKSEELGAKIVGLGAFTSVAGDAGVTVARNVGIAVTTGNSYTVATALQGVDYAADLLDIDLGGARVAVLGASGSIGKACARIMARKGYEITLVARRREPLLEVAKLIEEESGTRARVETEVSAGVRDADVVLAVTSAVDAVVDPMALKSGAIVCDVARPRNVGRQVAELRDDVFVFEGGVVRPPGDVEFNFNFGFPAKTCYACMAETMILTLEKRFENFSLGRDLDPEKVQEIADLAVKHGFSLAGLRSFERAVTDEYIDRVKSGIKRSKGKKAAKSPVLARVDTEENASV